MRYPSPLVVLTALALCLAATARAEDGRREINQTCATSSGCWGSDFPGFPVQIDEPGSYVLTSDLDVSASNQWGLRIVNVPDVTVDLNGFTITGAGSGSPGRDGIQVSGSPRFEVRNGTIRTFSGRGLLANDTSPGARVIGVRAEGNVIHGIDLDGGGDLVQGCTSSGNTLAGFAVVSGLVIDSVADENGREGLDLGAEAGYARNVLTDNNTGGAQVSGGVSLGANLCDAALCP